MKLYVLDYKVEDADVKIVSLKGYNSDADVKPQKDTMARVEIRSAADLASLGVPVLDALADFKSSSKIKVEATPEGIWSSLEPAPKDKSKDSTTGSGSKNSSKKSSDEGLTASVSGAKSLSTGDPAGGKGDQPGNGGKMAKAKKGSKPKKAAKKKAATKTAAKPKGDSNRGEKTKKIVALLTRTSGCTKAQMTEAVGWGNLSFPAFAKAQGLKLVKDKVEGKPTVYRGTAK